MSEDRDTVLIEGITHQLDNGRHVFVGQVPGDDTVYMQFFNGELDTKVRLSFEAAKALRDLLSSISSRGLVSSSTWVLVAEDKPKPSQVAPAV